MIRLLRARARARCRSRTRPAGRVGCLKPMLRAACSTARARPAACPYLPDFTAAASHRRSAVASGSACRAARCAVACAPPRRRCGPRESYGCSGFSTYTSLPAWHAQIVISACQWLRRGDADRVELLVFQGLANVLEALRRRATLGGDRLEPLGEGPAVRIDQIADLRPVQPQQGTEWLLPRPLIPATATCNPLVGPQYPPGAGPDGQRNPDTRNRPLDELATIDSQHGHISLSP